VAKNLATCVSYMVGPKFVGYVPGKVGNLFFCNLSETAVKSKDGEEEGRAGGRSQRAGQLLKLRVRRPQAFRCVGACVCAHTPGGRASAC
jgi:hypothetical protein